jgi:hypothetical protein
MTWMGHNEIPETREAQAHQEMLRNEAEHIHDANLADRVARESGVRPWWRRLFRRGKKDGGGDRSG